MARAGQRLPVPLRVAQVCYWLALLGVVAASFAAILRDSSPILHAPAVGLLAWAGMAGLLEMTHGHAVGRPAFVRLCALVPVGYLVAAVVAVLIGAPIEVADLAAVGGIVLVLAVAVVAVHLPGVTAFLTR